MLRYLSLALLIGVLGSCALSSEESNTQKEFGKSAEKYLVRFDEILFDSDSTAVIDFCKSSPEFCKLYFTEVLGIREPFATKAFWQNLELFRQDTFIQNIKKEVALSFKSLDGINRDLHSAVAEIKMIMPEYNFDKAYTYISPYTYQLFIFEEQKKDALGIGLDLFLHPKVDYKKVDPKNPIFSEYLVETYTKDYIAVKAIAMLLEEIIPPLGEQQRLLDHMIRNGKKRWLLQQILPKKDKHILMEMNEKDYSWCTENEREIWSFLVGKKMLYSSEIRKINKYVNPSPNSPGMPGDAPGRTANFIGFMIIDKYMKLNSNTSVHNLLNDLDAQKILDKSKYRPK